MSTGPTAPQLYAQANNTKCEGDQECHWCAAPCRRFWVHDEPAPPVGVRRPSTARRPGNAYVCSGCWLFRRLRISVRPLGGGRPLDGRRPARESWLVTPHGAWTLHGRASAAHLYPVLLRPPPLFALAVRDAAETLLHACPVNAAPVTPSGPKWEADAPLLFTLDNAVLRFSSYELEEALRRGADGKEPGVRALLRLFGPFDRLPPEIALPVTGKRGRKEGHHPDAKQHLKRVVTGSG